MQTTVDCPICGEPIKHGLPSWTLNQGDSVILSNSLVLDCPSCGQRLTLPPGTSFSNVDPNGRWLRALSEALVPSGVTPDDYDRLARLLREARATNISPEEIADRIQVEVPVFARLAKSFTSPMSQSIAMWIAAIMALIVYFRPLAHDDSGQATPSPPSEITVTVCVSPVEQGAREDVAPSVVVVTVEP